MELTVDRFPYSEYRNTTPRTMFDKAIEKLRRTEISRQGDTRNLLSPMLYDQLESVGFGPRFEFDAHFPPDGPLPRHRYLAIYAVEGDNEGHYIHVDFIAVSDVITASDRKCGINRWEAIPLMYMKTFSGLDFSLEVVATLTRFFNFNA